MNSGTLFVVATPIGNLEDVTLRALRILGEVQVIAAEDTRVTAKLLSHHGIATPMTSIRGGSGARHVAALVARLSAGEDVALVTDAGTPSVSDPGYELVDAAHAEGIRVAPVPGPSALAAAVSVVGLRGEGVRFMGFLPRSGRRRSEMLASLRTERALVVLYESPRRVAATLQELSAACGGDRKGAVLRELTKIHEETVRSPLSALATLFQEGTRGEVILAVEGVRDADAPEMTEEALSRIIAEELASGRSVKDVAASVSGGFGLSRNRIYRLALDIHRAR